MRVLTLRHSEFLLFTLALGNCKLAIKKSSCPLYLLRQFLLEDLTDLHGQVVLLRETSRGLLLGLSGKLLKL